MYKPKLSFDYLKYSITNEKLKNLKLKFEAYISCTPVKKRVIVKYIG